MDLRSENYRIEEKFNNYFSFYQKELKKNPSYISYEAFKDLKVIFDLYSQVIHLNGFNYGILDPEKLKKLIEKFDHEQKKELLEHLVRCLVKQGNEGEAKKVMLLITNIDIEFYFSNLLKGKKITTNLFYLIHKSISYNIYICLLFLLIYTVFSTLIFFPAPFDWMEVIEVQQLKITDNTFLNNLNNFLLFIFDNEEKMKIKPINFVGVLLIIAMKSLLIIIVINYLIKETFSKIKLQ